MASRTLCMFMCILAAIGPCHARRTQQQDYSDWLSSSSLAWPTNKPWDEINLKYRKVLGEGSFGIAARYYTTCNKDHSVVVKEVKQSKSMAMYERVEMCEEAIVETSVQMLMAEKGHAVRIFALTPKHCDEWTLRYNPEIYIMMARARGDGSPNKGKRAPISLMLDIANQLFRGTHELHKLGYLHRDIKPGNLLFETQRAISAWEDCAVGFCRFTLSDYGLACRRKLPKWGGRTTCTESSCGTPLFVPPEIARSVLAGDRTEYHYSRGMDYWALGITLYEMYFHNFPGSLGSFYSVSSIRRYLKDLGARGDVDWWKKNEEGKKDQNGRFLDDAESSDVKLFRDILSKLLIPSRSGREKAVHDEMPTLLSKIGVGSVPIPKVCVDPCNRCSDREECRAEHVIWQCVQAPPATIDVSVTVIMDSIYGTWKYYDDKGRRRSFDIIEKDGGNFIRGENIFSESPSVFAELRPQEDSDWLVAELWASTTSLGWLGFRLSNCGVGQVTHRPADSTVFGKVINAHAANRIRIKFELDDSNIGGNELRDLKVLVAKKFNMDVEQAAFFYDGVEYPLEDLETLSDKGELYLSPPLRHALVSGPLVGRPLAAAIADAKRKQKLTFPYIDVAQDIMKVWPAERWPSARRALRSPNIADQAKLASSLRPLVKEAKKFFQVPSPLVAWSKLLDDLSAPLEARMEEDRKQAMSNTRERCRKVGYKFCAQEVRMEMGDAVDYVKVDYTVGDEARTKLKFFKDGRIVKTRGEAVVKHKAVTLDAPTLPGSIPLTITLCQNLLAQPASIMNFGNLFVKSESRCKPIGGTISYTLRSDGATKLPQEAISDRLQMKFQVSAAPEVAFYIWDGDYQLESHEMEWRL